MSTQGMVFVIKTSPGETETTLRFPTSSVVAGQANKDLLLSSTHVQQQVPFITFIFLVFTYVYMYVAMCLYVCRCPHRLEALNLMDLEMQVVVIHPKRVLGIKLMSSARVTSVLNC